MVTRQVFTVFNTYAICVNDVIRTERILFVGGDLPKSSLATLEECGFKVQLVPDSRDAYSELAKSHFDLVIVNLVELTEGIDFIKRIRTTMTLNSVPVLVVGDWGSGQPAFALSKGADAYEKTAINALRLIGSIERVR